MSWKDRMNAGIGEYLRSLGVDAIEVTGYHEEVDVYSYGGCDTCGPDYDKEFELSIYYKDSKGESKTYTWGDTFTAFLNNIT
jgi:hypothetical protein